MITIFDNPPDFENDNRFTSTSNTFKTVYKYKKYGGPSLKQFDETLVPVTEWIYSQDNSGQVYTIPNVTMFASDSQNNTKIDLYYIMKEDLTS